MIRAIRFTSSSWSESSYIFHYPFEFPFLSLGWNKARDPSFPTGKSSINLLIGAEREDLTARYVSESNASTEITKYDSSMSVRFGVKYL